MAPTPAAPVAPFDGQTFFGTSQPVGAGGQQSPIPSVVSWLRSDVTLTSAQILALLGTSVPLVAAPGVGSFIMPQLVIMRLIAGSAAYTDAGGAVSLGAGTLTVALANNNIFLVTTSPNTRKLVLPWASAAAGTGVIDTAANPPTEDNAAFAISKATNNFAAGNGTMHITTYYTIETTV
jgi:hypothetical protein